MRDPIWDGEQVPVRRPLSEQQMLEVCKCPDRRAILVLLRMEPRSVHALVDALGTNMKHASNHLRILSRAGLVDYDRDKNRHLYRLTDAAVLTISREFVRLAMTAENGASLDLKFTVVATRVRSLSAAVEAWLNKGIGAPSLPC